MIFDAKETGQRIRTRRNELKISPTKAALDLHVSPDYLRKIELGHRNPSIDLLLSLSEYLDVSMDYLTKGNRRSRALHTEIDDVIKKLTAIQEKY